MFAIKESLYGHNDRGCQSLGELVCTNCVVLQREIREHHKTTEGGREREDFQKRQTLWREDVQLCTQHQSQGGHGKVYEGEGHTGKTISDVDEFVYEDNADGRGKVQQHTDSNPLCGGHTFLLLSSFSEIVEKINRHLYSYIYRLLYSDLYLLVSARQA